MEFIVIGIVALLIGIVLIPIGYFEFKEELQSIRAQPLHKKIIIYPLAFFSFINFDSIIGWAFSLGMLLVLSGSAIILLLVF
ncbi:hypothetical protein [Ureibacillus sinduriensis]|uniref:Uncharacterized protein n=1 Tax=Ureibacillus sinduriensis BLB-1 = JCM 15800 TaxID=1384057 RepID=A0A0A3IA45_9BACL|nr:hypothetical protein [Ureibacillus sinduriensis]KGR79678.1 hypothetical protein CD33_00345 [Ureibacillus sinduriensis BLB-1 = JCM 15800]